MPDNFGELDIIIDVDLASDFDKKIERIGDKLERILSDSLKDAGKIGSKSFFNVLNESLKISKKNIKDLQKSLQGFSKNSDINKTINTLTKSLKQLDQSLDTIGTSNQDIVAVNKSFSLVTNTLNLLKKQTQDTYKTLQNETKKSVNILVNQEDAYKSIISELLQFRRIVSKPIQTTELKDISNTFKNIFQSPISINKNKLLSQFETLNRGIKEHLKTTVRIIDQNGNLVEKEISELIDDKDIRYIDRKFKELTNKIGSADTSSNLLKMEKQIGDFVNEINKLTAGFSTFNLEGDKLDRFNKIFKKLKNSIDDTSSEFHEFGGITEKIFKQLNNIGRGATGADFIDKEMNELIAKLKNYLNVIRTQKKEHETNISTITHAVERKRANTSLEINKQRLKKEEKQHRTFWEKIKKWRQGSLFRSFVDIKTFMVSVVYLFQRVGRAISYTIEQFQSLESGIKLASTLVDNATLIMIGGLDKLSEIITDIAYKFGTDIPTATSAMYKALTSGVPVEQLENILDIGNKLARGGKATFDVVLDGLTSVTNAFGDLNYSIESATRVSDAMFTAMRFGKFTLETLSQNLGQITAAASEMGISMEETVGVLATLTRTGLSAEEASTQIRSALKTILDPSQQAKKILTSLGLSFGRTAIESENLAQYLMDMKKTLRESGYGFQDVFENVRGLQGVFALTGNLADDYNMIMEEMNLNHMMLGATTENAYNKMADTSEMWEERSKAAWNNTMASIGEGLQPIKKAWDKFIYETLGTAEQKLSNIMNILKGEISVQNIVSATFGERGQFITEEIINNTELFEEKIRRLYVIAPDLANRFSFLAEAIRSGNLSMEHFRAELERFFKISTDEQLENREKLFDEFVKAQTEELSKLQIKNIISDEDMKEIVELNKEFSSVIESFRQIANMPNIAKGTVNLLRSFLSEGAAFGFAEEAIALSNALEKFNLTIEDFSNLTSLEENKRDLDNYILSLETNIKEIIQIFGVDTEEEINKIFSDIFNSLSTEFMSLDIFSDTNALVSFSKRMLELKDEIIKESADLIETTANESIKRTIGVISSEYENNLPKLFERIKEMLPDIGGESFIENEEIWLKALENQERLFKLDVYRKQVKNEILEIENSTYNIRTQITELEERNLMIQQQKNNYEEEYIEMWNQQYALSVISNKLQLKSIENGKEEIKNIANKITALEELQTKIESEIDIENKETLREKYINEIQNIFSDIAEISSDAIGEDIQNFISETLEVLNSVWSEASIPKLDPFFEDIGRGLELEEDKILMINNLLYDILDLNDIIREDLAKPLTEEKITDGYGNLLDNVEGITSETIREIQLNFEDMIINMKELSNKGDIDFRISDDMIEGLTRVRSVIKEIRDIAPEIADRIEDAFGDNKFFNDVFDNISERLEGLGLIGREMYAEMEREYQQIAERIMDDDEKSMEEKIFLLKETYEIMVMQAEQAENDIKRIAIEYAENAANIKLEFQESIINGLNVEGEIHESIQHLIRQENLTIFEKNQIIKDTITQLTNELEAHKANLLATIAQKEAIQGNIDNLEDSLKNANNIINMSLSSLGSIITAYLNDINESITDDTVRKRIVGLREIFKGYLEDIEEADNVTNDMINNLINSYKDLGEEIDSALGADGSIESTINRSAETLRNAFFDANMTEDAIRIAGQLLSIVSTAEGDITEVIDIITGKIDELNDALLNPEIGEAGFEAITLDDTDIDTSSVSRRRFSLDDFMNIDDIKAQLSNLYREMYSYWRDLNQQETKTFLDLMFETDNAELDRLREVLRGYLNTIYNDDENIFEPLLDNTDDFISEWEGKLLEIGNILDQRRTEWEDKIRDLYLTNANVIANALEQINSKTDEINELISEASSSTEEEIDTEYIDDLNNSLSALESIKTQLETLAVTEDISLEDVESLINNIQYVFTEGGQYSLDELKYVLGEEFVTFINEIGEQLSVEGLITREAELLLQRLKYELQQEINEYVEGQNKKTLELFQNIPRYLTDFYMNHFEETSDWLNQIDDLSLNVSDRVKVYGENIKDYSEQLTNLIKKYSDMTAEYIININTSISTGSDNLLNSISNLISSGELLTDDLLLQMKEAGYTIADLFYTLDDSISPDTVLNIQSLLNQFREYVFTSSDMYRDYQEILINLQNEFAERKLELEKTYQDNIEDEASIGHEAYLSLVDEFNVRRLNAEYEYQRELLQIASNFQKEYIQKAIEYYESIGDLSLEEMNILENLKAQIRRINLNAEFEPLLNQVSILIQEQVSNINNILDDIGVEFNLDEFTHLVQEYQRISRDRRREFALLEKEQEELTESEKNFLEERTNANRDYEDEIIDQYNNISNNLLEYQNLLKDGEDLEGLSEEDLDNLNMYLESLDELLKRESDIIEFYNKQESSIDNTSESVEDLSDKYMSLFELIQKVEKAQFRFLHPEDVEVMENLLFNIREAEERLNFLSTIFRNTFGMEYTEFNLQELEKMIINLESELNDLSEEERENYKKQLNILLDIYETRKEIYDLSREAYKERIKIIEEEYSMWEDIDNIFSNIFDLTKIQEMINETQRFLDINKEERLNEIQREIALLESEKSKLSGDELKVIEEKIKALEEERRLLNQNTSTQKDLIKQIEERNKAIYKLGQTVIEMTKEFANTSLDSTVDNIDNFVRNIISTISDTLKQAGIEGKIASIIIDSIVVILEIVERAFDDTTSQEILNKQTRLQKVINNLMEHRNELMEAYNILNTETNDSMSEQIEFLKESLNLYNQLTGLVDGSIENLGDINKDEILQNYEDLMQLQEEILTEINWVEKEMEEAPWWESAKDWLSGLFGENRQETIDRLNAELETLNIQIERYEELLELIDKIAELERKRLETYGGFAETFNNLSGDQEAAIRSQLYIYQQILSQSDELMLSQEERLDYLLKIVSLQEQYNDLITSRFKSEQELALKRAEIEARESGATEEEISQMKETLRNQIINDRIQHLETLLSQIDGLDAQLEIEHEIADLELERLEIQKDMNEEMDKRNALYDKELRTHLRAVIEARKLNDDIQEQQSLFDSAERMLELGLNAEEIYRLLGVDVEDLGLITPETNNVFPINTELPEIPDLEENTESMNDNLEVISDMIQEEIGEIPSMTAILSNLDNTVNDIFGNQEENKVNYFDKNPYNQLESINRNTFNLDNLTDIKDGLIGSDGLINNLVGETNSLATAITDMSDSTITLSETTGGLQENIHGLDTSLDTLTSGIDNLNTTTGGLQGNIDGLDTSLDTLTSGIDNLNTTTGGLQENIDELDTSANTLTSDIVDLNTTTGGLQGTIDGLDTSLDTLTSGIDNLNTTTGGLQGTIDGLDTSLDTLTSGITTLNTTTGGLQGTIDGLDTSANTLTSGMTTLNTTTGGLQETIDGLDTTANTLTSGITGLNSNINTLSGRVINLDDRINTKFSNLSTALDNWVTGSNELFNTYITASEGGIVSGPSYPEDIVPAMLTGGEYVINKEATSKNLDLLESINSGKIQSNNEYYRALNEGISRLSENIIKATGNNTTIGINVYNESKVQTYGDIARANLYQKKLYKS